MRHFLQLILQNRPQKRSLQRLALQVQKLARQLQICLLYTSQKQSLEARIQYIANYYGLTYEEDTTAVHQNQTDSNTDTGANTTDATIQSQQQQQYTPTVDAGTQTPSQTAQ